jgi:hypothetical protein
VCWPATLTAGTGVVLAGQSGVALGSEEERARLFAAASCILLFGRRSWPTWPGPNGWPRGPGRSTTRS